MLRFAALIVIALMLAPSLAAAQGAEPVGTVSDDETSFSRAYDGDVGAGAIVGIFAIGSIGDTESQAMGMMATLPPVFASGLGSSVEDAGVIVGEPEDLTVATIGNQSVGLRVPYTMFGSLEGEIVIVGVRQSTWVQMLIGMGVGEAGVQAQLEDLARQLLPRWPSADPVTVRPDGLRTGGIWNMAPMPEDLPAGFAVDPNIEDGPAVGTVSPVPEGAGASQGTTPTEADATPSPSLDLPLLPTPPPAGGETPAPPQAPPSDVTPIETSTPSSAPDVTPTPVDVATPAPNPRVALPFDVTVEIFLPLEMATIDGEDGSCSGAGLLDGLSGDAEVTLQGASTAGDGSASGPMSGPGQVALDRETGEEICYFRASVPDVPPRARYSLLAGETVLGQYTYGELTETGSILVVIDDD